MKTIYSFLALLTMVAVVSCSEKKNTVTKAPVRVKVEHPLAAQRSSATYVGVVEEHEATAVSFTSNAASFSAPIWTRKRLKTGRCAIAFTLAAIRTRCMSAKFSA